MAVNRLQGLNFLHIRKEKRSQFVCIYSEILFILLLLMFFNFFQSRSR